MPRLIICWECGEKKGHFAKELCERCYKRLQMRRLRASNPLYKEREQRYHKKRYEDPEIQERYRQYSREYREAHKERIQNQNAAFRARHPDYDKIWKRNNRKPINASRRKAYQRNPEIARGYLVRRRARKLALPDTLTNDQLAQKLSMPCFYCGRGIDLTLDHFVGLGAEGNVVCGTTLANSVAACQSCNSWKHSRLPRDILEQLPLRAAVEELDGQTQIS